MRGCVFLAVLLTLVLSLEKDKTTASATTNTSSPTAAPDNTTATTNTSSPTAAPDNTTATTNTSSPTAAPDNTTATTNTSSPTAAPGKERGALRQPLVRLAWGGRVCGDLEPSKSGSVPLLWLSQLSLPVETRSPRLRLHLLPCPPSLCPLAFAARGTCWAGFQQPGCFPVGVSASRHRPQALTLMSHKPAMRNAPCFLFPQMTPASGPSWGSLCEG
ncbi:uncharacterized protein [Apteryx mantelli]|uniref:Uncharacterized protein n=1 Tax=Apteryx mantelli TaxID=2696672 RepID=A0ABM4ERU9_9AVES